jgi:proline dehydrogenase
VAFASREEATENYARIMEYLFENSNDTLIATHDDKLIHRALELERKYGKKVSFAMLRGIRGRLANELLEKGESVSIYIPFGEKWMDYSIRRLKEAGHAALLLRSIFQQ